MSLYTPTHFRDADPARALALLRAFPFATLVTAVDGAEPAVSHLPLLVERESPLVLAGHLARANPHVEALARGRTIAIFHGPNAYVSPLHYVDPARHVPTWNYAVVHVAGTVERLDPAATRRVVEDVTRHFEAGAWAPSAEALDRLLPAVAGFRLHAGRVEAKRKMSQNRDAADRAKLAAALRAGDAAARAVADWIDPDDRG